MDCDRITLSEMGQTEKERLSGPLPCGTEKSQTHIDTEGRAVAARSWGEDGENGEMLV